MDACKCPWLGSLGSLPCLCVLYCGGSVRMCSLVAASTSYIGDAASSGECVLCSRASMKVGRAMASGLVAVVSRAPLVHLTN